MDALDVANAHGRRRRRRRAQVEPERDASAEGHAYALARLQLAFELDRHAVGELAPHRPADGDQRVARGSGAHGGRAGNTKVRASERAK